MTTWIQRSKRAGLALAEQGMVVALVAIVAIAVVKSVSGKATNTYDNIQSQMTAQSIDSSAPQIPIGMAAATSGGSGGSDADREKSNNGNHYGQIRNGNNGNNNP